MAKLSSGSVELDFVNATSNPVVIKPGQIVATALQIDSVEMLPDIEPHDDKSIPSTESVFSCVENTDNFLYPCIISDEAMDDEEKEFDLDMDIIEPPLAGPRATPREKGKLIDCVQDLLFRASKNLSPEEMAKLKELLVEHNETPFHDPEKPLTRTDTIVHEITTTCRPLRIPPHRIAPGRRKIVEDEILKMEKEGTICKAQALGVLISSWCERKMALYVLV